MSTTAERAEAADAFSRKELARGNEIIDALRAERDQLRAEVERLNQLCESRKQVSDDFCARAEKAEAQVRTLREALEQLKEYASDLQVAEDRSNLDGDSAEEVLAQLNQAGDEMEEIIRQALAAIDAARKEVGRE